MDNPAVAISNPARLAALRRLALLDTPTEQAFDRLTRLAAQILRAPIALIVLVDADRQFFKSCVGLPEPWASQRETALVYSFCQHAVAANQPLLIADARTHPLVQDNPAIHDLDAVAYAGIPLMTTDGYTIGTFCVIDRVVRIWTSEEIAILNDLAAAVMTEIELRGEMIERQRAEAELERFFALSYDLFCIVGIDGYFKRLNPAWEKTLGFSLDELMAEPYMHFIHPDDQAGSTAITEQAVSGLNPQFFENRYRCKDGSYKWLQWTGTFSADHQAFYSMARDVSERKRLEAQFLQAQKMESVGRLAGSVAHDFNNLLTTIIGYSELALDELSPTDLVYADLEEIQRMARRAAALTHQLLAFSRERIIEPQTLNLNALVLDMTRLLRRLIGEHIELAIQTAPDLGPVKADPGQIEQLIVNLAMNARDAMPNGGKLMVETVNIYLDQQYVRQHIGVTEGPYVLLSITDTGSGMDEEVQRHIFEPFFTTKGAGKGSGIGLATCYGIVKQHGGHIWIYSEANRGTSINVYLPIVADGTTALRTRDDRGDSPRGSETVLLVEDEQTVRELTGRVLREQGYTVLEAANGNDALQAAASYAGRINLLLTDMVMPQMGGGVLAERFMVLYPDIRVLFMSGYTDNAIIHYHRATPAHAFLQKPFTPSFLARKVRDVLDS